MAGYSVFMDELLSKPNVSVDISRHGWCMKQGGSVKSWKRRYACILGTCFFYFTNAEDYQVFVNPKCTPEMYRQKRLETAKSFFDFNSSTLHVDEEGAKRMGIKTSEPLLEVFTHDRIYHIFFEEASPAWTTAFREALRSQESHNMKVPQYLEVRDLMEQGELLVQSTSIKSGTWVRCGVVVTFFNCLIFKALGDNRPILNIKMNDVYFQHLPFSNEFTIERTMFKGVTGSTDEIDPYVRLIEQIQKVSKELPPVEVESFPALPSLVSFANSEEAAEDPGIVF